LNEIASHTKQSDGSDLQLRTGNEEPKLPVPSFGDLEHLAYFDWR
jgi:hypothetical protein